MGRVAVLFVSLVLVSLSQCYKKQFVERRPVPMKSLIAEKLNGKWYHIGRYIPCAYQGSREFTDNSRTYNLDREGRFYDVTNIYRSGSKCRTLNDVRTIKEGNCAVQFVKDPIGDLYTGERIIVATDYKRFLIEWACLKVSQADPNICKDPALYAMARVSDPAPRTRHIIDSILRKMFNLVVKDLDIMIHDNPC